MNQHEILTYLQTIASETYKANIIKAGIPEAYCIGVPTPLLRNLARTLEPSNELAFELWNTGYHEARLLAVLIFRQKQLTYAQIDALMSDVISWDLCDHLCKNLIIKRKDYDEYILHWISSGHIYKKRAAFTLIASASIHDKQITADALDRYLKLIYEHSDSPHEHVKKAASWALREIGKIDFDYNEKALLTAYNLLESESKSQVWIARHAIKELENLVEVKERKRLISALSH